MDRTQILVYGLTDKHVDIVTHWDIEYRQIKTHIPWYLLTHRMEVMTPSRMMDVRDTGSFQSKLTCTLAVPLATGMDAVRLTGTTNTFSSLTDGTKLTDLLTCWDWRVEVLVFCVFGMRGFVIFLALRGFVIFRVLVVVKIVGFAVDVTTAGLVIVV